jgi:hypothetical protein
MSNCSVMSRITDISQVCKIDANDPERTFPYVAIFVRRLGGLSCLACETGCARSAQDRDASRALCTVVGAEYSSQRSKKWSDNFDSGHALITTRSRLLFARTEV